jgi:hypothetical protein
MAPWLKQVDLGAAGQSRPGPPFSCKLTSSDSCCTLQFSCNQDQQGWDNHPSVLEPSFVAPSLLSLVLWIDRSCKTPMSRPAAMSMIVFAPCLDSDSRRCNKVNLASAATVFALCLDSDSHRWNISCICSDYDDCICALLGL